MFKMLAMFGVCGRWINEYKLTLPGRPLREAQDFFSLVYQNTFENFCHPLRGDIFSNKRTIWFLSIAVCLFVFKMWEPFASTNLTPQERWCCGTPLVTTRISGYKPMWMSGAPLGSRYQLSVLLTFDFCLKKYNKIVFQQQRKTQILYMYWYKR